MKNPAETPHHNGQQSSQQELFEFNLLQLANYLYSSRRWIATGTFFCVLIALIWVTFIKQPIYRATVTINIDLLAEGQSGPSAASPFWIQDQMVGNKIGVVEQYFDSQEFRNFLLRTMAADDLPDAMKKHFQVIKAELNSRKVIEPDDTVDWLHGKIDLRGFAEKSRIDLTGSANRPQLAAAIANFGSYALTEYNRLLLLKRLKNLKTFLNTQTMITKKELRTLENQLVTLQKQAKIISPDEARAKINSLQVDQEAKLIEFDRQFAALTTLITETEADLTYFKGLMQENKPSSHLYIEQIQRRLEILRYQKIQEAETRRSDERPDSATGPNRVADRSSQIDDGINEVIGELSRQLEKLGPVSASPWDYVKKIEGALFELKQKRSQAKSEVLAQQQAVKRTTKEFIGLPDVLKQMSEVKRNIDLTTSLYTALMTRLQETQIKEAAHSNDLVVVSSAEIPGTPSGLGRTKTMMLSVIGGLLISCLPLFLRFVLLPTIRNQKDLKHLRVPIVGAVGWYRGATTAPLPLRLLEKSTRLLKEAPASPEANAIRMVRFQLEQALSIRAFAAGQASKLVMIGSVNPKEGRTFTAANLADLFAGSGVRTCVIDLDFSKPGVQDFFPEATIEDSPMTEMFPPACGFKMMRVSDKLTVLSPQPKSEPMSELLETREFESALNALEVIFELIIIDSPPLTGHMEPIIAAQYADAFLLVINQRRTLRTEVEDSIRVLQGALPKLPIFGMMNLIFDEVSQARRKNKKLDRKDAGLISSKPPTTPPGPADDESRVA